MSLERKKPAHGTTVSLVRNTWRAFMPGREIGCNPDGSFGPDKLKHDSQAEAIAATHVYVEHLARPHVEAFAERVAASLYALAKVYSDPASTEFNRLADAVLAAASDSAVKLPWENDE